MDSSLQSTHTTTDEINASLAVDHAGAEAEEEHHVHLPNPSLWPLILSAAILLGVAGLLFIPANFWLTLIAIPIVLIGIMGWALEDPMSPIRESFVTIRQRASLSRFHIGQDVFDKDGEWLGTVRARFPNYILVEHGGLLIKPYYIPQRFAKSNIERNIVALSLSENELKSSGYNAIPDDLYDEAPDLGLPPLNGTPLFARGPLSPAETGHYNYGPNSPGINTDASGSYHREEVLPRPQRYVASRRRLYATDPAVASKVPEIPAGIEESGQLYSTDRTIPPRTISPD
jgi:hypothetical protein